MLLSSRGKPYVCWRCVSQHAHTTASLSVRQNRRLNHTTARTTKPEIEIGPLRHHNVPDGHAIPRVASTSQSPGHKTRPKLSIREELKAWAISNETPDITNRPLDVSLATRVNNSLTRSQSQLFALDEGNSDGADLGDAFSVGEDEGVSIVGANDRQVGDLVELTNAISRVGTLAVYLGYFSNRHHFYSHDSKWLMSTGFPAVFSVAQFATEAELKLVLGAIPMGVSVEVYQQLQKQNQGPSRHDGAALLNKMRDFRLESELVHQNNIKSLDAARELLAHETETRHLSLFEITDILLPNARNADGSFPASALYSVLTVLRREDIAFRPLSPTRDCHRQDYMFEVIANEQIQSIARAVAAVREYNQVSVKTGGVPHQKQGKPTAMSWFVERAQEVVQRSRAVRGWTPHGTLEPSGGFSMPDPDWKDSSLDILNFLEWWASYDVFSASSRYHGYGSTILRATGLYENVPLDQRTAWTFLQELGHISWREIPSRFRIRLPGTSFVKGGGLTREPLREDAINKSQQQDIAADRRVEIRERVFCIDDASTVIIDDGLSLERTENPEEFWIHVHVADPASRILAHSDLSKFFELIPENIYLPGHFQAMLPAQLGNDGTVGAKGLLEQLSLHPGSAALTFSAKVNQAGDILDTGIKPSRLTKVSYMDPQDVSAFCGESRSMPVPEAKLSVGGPYQQQTYGEPRSMTTPEQLDQSSQEDLRTLYSLSLGLKSKRLARGAWPVFPPRPVVSVTFPPSPATSDQDDTSSIHVPGAPQIDVSYQTSEGSSVVSNTMVLAGQIAARWCSERGIPIPFRRDTSSANNYDNALAFVNKQVYPLIRNGVDPGREHRGILSALIGGVELSSSPGPYFILGVDEYAKVTSPLRRYGDMLAHWQIHAALAHEHKTGQKVEPSMVNEIVPFSDQDMTNAVILLQMREKMIRAISQGSRDWILIALVRAWRAGDGSVPAKMRFTVTTRATAGLLGELDFFDLPASMDTVQMDGKVLIQDVSVGDQLDVELADVNVYDGTITVKALEYLGRTESSPPSPKYDTRPLIPAAVREKGLGIFTVASPSTASPSTASPSTASPSTAS